MPKLLHLLRYWTLLASLAIIFSVYFVVIEKSVDERYNGDQYRIAMKKIVAYSLLKQIEMESEEYNCNKQYSTSSAYSERDYGSSENRNSTREFEEDSWTHIEDTNLYVSSVNVDRSLDPYVYIRIIGVVKGNISDSLVCQIETNSGIYRSMTSTIKPIWYEEWDNNDTNQYYNPVLLSCRVPFNEKAVSVSITKRPCEVKQQFSFRLPDIPNSVSRDFTVCVKPLDFREDIKHHLIQWIEIMKMLGANKIELYVKKLQEETLRVLKWYAEKYPNTIKVRFFQTLSPAIATNASDVSTKIWQRRRYEIVAYNNCFYRNSDTSRFVIPLDIDEIILPKIAPTWKELLKKINLVKNLDEYASLSVSNTYFSNKKSKKYSVFFLDNFWRSPYSPEGDSGKSFINTRNTVTVFNHYALNVTPGVNRVYFLPTEWVQMNHYKSFCDISLLTQCANYNSSQKIVDTSILRFKSRFILNYNRILTELKKLHIL